MKMKTLYGLLLAASVFSIGTASAADLKVGIVDVKSALENTSAYKQGFNRLKSLATKKQKELEALQQKIEQAEKDMLGQSMAMSPERLSQKQTEIKDLRKLYSRKQQDAQEELQSERSKLEGRMGMKFRAVLDEFGKKGGYDLILTKAPQFVLFSSSTHDVTPEITKLLDKK